MFRNMRLWLRFVLLGLSFSLPLVLLVYFLIDEQAGAIEFTSAEVRGVTYHRSARQVLEALIRHRSAVVSARTGDASVKLKDREAAVDTALAELKQVDAELGAEMRTTPQLLELEKEWTRIKGEAATADLTVFLPEYDALVYDMTRVIIRMGNHSNLILDPDIDTYYLMDSTQFKLAYAANELGRAQAYGVLDLSAPSVEPRAIPATLGVTARLAAHQAELLAEENSTNLGYAFEANPAVKAAVASSTQINVDEAKAVAKAATVTTDAGAWNEVTEKALVQDLRLFDACLDNLGLGLDNRIARLQSRRMMVLGVIGAAFVFASALSLLILRSITGSLSALSEAVDRVSLGHLDVRVPTEGTDEVADLARKFVRMQESIRLTLSMQPAANHDQL